MAVGRAASRAGDRSASQASEKKDVAFVSACNTQIAIIPACARCTLELEGDKRSRSLRFAAVLASATEQD
eukprot:2489806-Amphidinium_carterae.1